MSVLHFPLPAVPIWIGIDSGAALMACAAPPMPANRQTCYDMRDELRYLSAQIREFLHRQNTEAEAEAHLARLQAAIAEIGGDALLARVMAAGSAAGLPHCGCGASRCRLGLTRIGMLALADRLDREAADDGA